MLRSAPALVLAAQVACFVDQAPEGASMSGAESTGATATASSTATATTSTSTSTSTESTSATSATTTAATTTSSTSESASEGTTSTSTGEPDTTTGPGAPLLCGLPLDGWTLTAPTPIPGLSTTHRETDPWFMPGDLRLLFATDTAGTSDLWRTERPSIGAEWGPPTLADDLGVNTSASEGHVLLTADELGIILATNRPGGLGGADLWIGIRAALDVPFDNLLDLPDINSAKNEFDAWLSSDGLRIYFNVQDNASSTIVVSERPDVATLWSATTPVAGLFGGDALDASPFLLEDERLIFFSSLKNGGGDVWWATRADRSLPFDPPTPAPTINLADSYEGEPGLSSDGCELLFVSNRGKPSADWDVYQARVVAR